MDNINDILAKHFSGLQLSSEEQSAMENWRLENPKEFEVLKATMRADSGDKYHEFDLERGWDKMSKRIDASTTKTFSLRPILKYAVAASIVAIIGVFGFQLLTNSTEDMIAFENNTNAVDSLLLPDGTQLFLAANSKVEYAKDFKEHRDIKLEGEAFFDVFRNESKPFIIETAYGNVEVLGTSFNVNTFEQKTRVDVKTGLVSLSNGSQDIKLTVNESAWSDGTNISEKTVVNDNVLSWKTGEFNFSNTPIDEAVKFLESFFGDVIDLELKSQEKCEFTGSFSNQNIDGIIEAIVLSCNLEFSKENDRFILK